MNGWLLAAAILLAGGGGVAVTCVATGPLRRRLIAQNLSTSLVCVALLLLAQGYGRSAYVDAGLELAILGPVGTLVFARLLADELRHRGPRAPRLTAATAAGTAVAVIALAVAAGGGRATVKLLLIGGLLIAGNVVASRALAGGLQEGARPESGRGTP
ncbi:MrpF/PhaF family protein [Streptomyces sp. TS71-3]|uniref:MrpF/PhaF family protein n=1 Tax=Streptomyces sp. TS71-3 TaxID=2733862 RepID=UPI001B259992|nr:MrpF/PhaF family protein [Streptomyces sp. TS71-3]GHJ42503.1 hypothetical protein Sm713_81120 [Streptomyces sp. TS71-3]